MERTTRKNRGRIARVTSAAVAAIAAAAFLPACGAPSDAAEDRRASGGEDPRAAFFDALSERCGDEYPGRAIVAPASDDVFHPAYLGMRIASCSDHEIRVVFRVNEDESRTWVIERGDDGLLFTHEHRREDGTLYENSGWGGWATEYGTPLFQHFPDHRWTPEGVPEDRRSHWRLRLDPENGQFVYYLDRGLEPAYRLVFHMGQSRQVLELAGGGRR
jgi:hypothetical protein